MSEDAGRIGIFGASGSGKTTRLQAIIAKAPRVVYFDPMHKPPKGYVTVETVGGLVAKLRSSWRRGKFRIAYAPDRRRVPHHLHDVACALYAAANQWPMAGKIVLAVDEVNLGFPVTRLPDELFGFGDLCSRGRHYGIELVACSQRPAEVSTIFRGNMSESYWFRAEDHNDRAAAKAKIGHHAERLMRLPNHVYLHKVGPALFEGKNGGRAEKPVT